MPDKVFIQDLLVRTIIGVNPDERERRQDVLINIALEVDTRPAAKADDLDLAVNYATVNKRVIALVEESHYFLLEALAEAIANACLEDQRVDAVTVRVDKPHVVRYARSVGVEIRRTRT